MLLRTIGLAFPDGCGDVWRNRIDKELDLGDRHFDVVECASMEACIAESPQILVGHESDYLTQYLLSNPPTLHWMHFMSAGLDRTLQALGRRPRSFRISNVRGIHGEAMSEYVLSALLHFEKQVPRFVKAKKHRQWERFGLNLLHGKLMVVVGAGAIGSAIAATVRKLGMRTVGVTRSGRSSEHFDEAVDATRLLDALPSADYVVCAAPLTDETRGMIGVRAFEAMKLGTIFVNVARGELVDESALIAALESGKLSGAAMDAFVEEPLPHESPLWQAPNLLITPHIAGKFEGGRDRGVDMFLQNLDAFLDGCDLVTEVFPERGY